MEWKKRSRPTRLWPGAPPSDSQGAGIGATCIIKAEVFLFLGVADQVAVLTRAPVQGGGALQINVDGDFTLAGGAMISASGGDGRTGKSTKSWWWWLRWFSAIFAQNINNLGMIRVLGGSGVRDGQILFASPGQIESGILMWKW